MTPRLACGLISAPCPTTVLSFPDFVNRLKQSGPPCKGWHRPHRLPVASTTQADVPALWVYQDIDEPYHDFQSYSRSTQRVHDEEPAPATSSTNATYDMKWEETQVASCVSLVKAIATALLPRLNQSVHRSTWVRLGVFDDPVVPATRAVGVPVLAPLEELLPAVVDGLNAALRHVWPPIPHGAVRLSMNSVDVASDFEQLACPPESAFTTGGVVGATAARPGALVAYATGLAHELHNDNALEVLLDARKLPAGHPPTAVGFRWARDVPIGWVPVDRDLMLPRLVVRVDAQPVPDATCGSFSLPWVEPAARLPGSPHIHRLGMVTHADVASLAADDSATRRVVGAGAGAGAEAEPPGIQLNVDPLAVTTTPHWALDAHPADIWCRVRPANSYDKLRKRVSSPLIGLWSVGSYELRERLVGEWPWDGHVRFDEPWHAMAADTNGRLARHTVAFAFVEADSADAFGGWQGVRDSMLRTACPQRAARLDFVVVATSAMLGMACAAGCPDDRCLDVVDLLHADFVPQLWDGRLEVPVAGLASVATGSDMEDALLKFTRTSTTNHEMKKARKLQQQCELANTWRWLAHGTPITEDALNNMAYAMTRSLCQGWNMLERMLEEQPAASGCPARWREVRLEKHAPRVGATTVLRAMWWKLGPWHDPRRPIHVTGRWSARLVLPSTGDTAQAAAVAAGAKKLFHSVPSGYGVVLLCDEDANVGPWRRAWNPSCPSVIQVSVRRGMSTKVSSVALGPFMKHDKEAKRVAEAWTKLPLKDSRQAAVKRAIKAMDKTNLTSERNLLDVIRIAACTGCVGLHNLVQHVAACRLLRRGVLVARAFRSLAFVAAFGGSHHQSLPLSEHLAKRLLATRARHVLARQRGDHLTLRHARLGLTFLAMRGVARRQLSVRDLLGTLRSALLFAASSDCLGGDGELVASLVRAVLLGSEPWKHQTPFVAHLVRVWEQQARQGHGVPEVSALHTIVAECAAMLSLKRALAPLQQPLRTLARQVGDKLALPRSPNQHRTAGRGQAGIAPRYPPAAAWAGTKGGVRASVPAAI